MMTRRQRSVSRAVKEYKRELYCKWDIGKLHIFQKSPYWPSPDRYVCSLTHNWKIGGEPVEWGVEAIKVKLKAMDMASDGGQEFISEVLASYEKDYVSKQRDRKNTMESFLYDYRSEFAKATNHINTGTLEKTDKRRLQWR